MQIFLCNSKCQLPYDQVFSTHINDKSRSLIIKNQTGLNKRQIYPLALSIAITFHV